MEQVIKFLIENYGAIGLLLIVVAGMAFIIIKELRKSNESLIEKQITLNKDMTNAITKSMSDLSTTLTNDLREQNKQLIDHFVFSKNRDAEQHSENLVNRKNVTIEINNIINDLRIELDADRVCVLEFHNSFANQTGFPFLKYTVTYEKIAKGCRTIQQVYQASQFSSICDVSERVLESPHHICELKNLDEIEDVVPIMLIDGRHVGSCLFKGIFDVYDNILIGLLCVEFKTSIPEDYDSIPLIAAARTIGELITLTKQEEEKKQPCNS